MMTALRTPMHGLLMALLALAGWFGFDASQMAESAQALQDQTGLLVQRADTLRVNLDQLANADATAHTRKGMHGFYAMFPDEATRDVRLAAILSRARQTGLALGQTEYRHRAEPGLALVRYSMSLPLTGSYAEIRRLIDDCLRADPALGLISLRLRRKDVQSEQVQAQIEFALYMRAPLAGVDG